MRTISCKLPWYASCRNLLVVSALLVSLVASQGLAADAAAPATPATATPERETTIQQETTANPAGSIPLLLVGDKLSVNVKDQPLGKVLNSLAQQAKVKVLISEDNAQQRVTSHFVKLPLFEGIRSLLQGKNYMLKTVPDARGNPIVMELRVLSPGEPVTTLTGSNEAQDEAFEALRQQALYAKEVSEREAAMEQLANMELPADQLVPIVRQGLQDENVEVRSAAVSLSSNVLLEHVPFDALAQAARTDPDPRLRSMALQMMRMLDGPTAQPHLEQALREETDPLVLQYAQALLDQVREQQQQEEQAPAEGDQTPTSTKPESN